MLAREDTDLEILSIAANGYGMSFSSDTGMAECLVIARKFKPDETPHDRVHFTSLRRRPRGFAHASSPLVGCRTGGQVRRLEDGPYGGTLLMVGEELAGEMITAPHDPGGDNWGAVRLAGLLPRPNRLYPIPVPTMAAWKPLSGRVADGKAGRHR